MLDKFQDQELFSTVEQLEDIKKKINSFTVIFLNNSEEEECILKDIDKVISSVKNIHPSLFNSPRVAKYNTPDGRYDPTPIINDDDNTIDGMDGEE